MNFLDLAPEPGPRALRRIAALLNTYEAVARTMLSGSTTLDSAALDAIFFQLRDYQRKHWTEGHACIDSLGLAACDLLEAASLHERRSPALDRSLQQHVLALALAREALVRELVT